MTPVEERKIINNAANKNRMQATHRISSRLSQPKAICRMWQPVVAQMHRSKEPLLHCGCIYQVSLHDPDQLKLLQTEVLTELVRSKLNVDRLLLRQRQGFISVMPSGWNVFGDQFERVLPASSVANLYPSTTAARRTLTASALVGTNSAAIS